MYTSSCVEKTSMSPPPSLSSRGSFAYASVSDVSSNHLRWYLLPCRQAASGAAAFQARGGELPTQRRAVPCVYHCACACVSRAMCTV